MGLLYKTALVGQVWLTAIMTLIAGIPQFSCICPNGATKPLCVSLPTDSSGCCCAGGRCCSPSREAGGAANADHPANKSCCAEHRAQKSEEQRAIRLLADHRCCTKTLTPRPVTAVSYHKTVVERDASFLTLIQQSVAPIPSRLATANGPTLWQISLVTPPTDLVVQLQHYLI